MPEINKIVKEGFYLNNQSRRLTGLAMLSLKIALKSYFSTYQSMKYFLHIFDSVDVSEEVKNESHSKDYCQQSSEAIIHFHHFFELVCKEILRNENPLLAVDASNKHALSQTNQLIDQVQTQLNQIGQQGMQNQMNQNQQS